MRVQKAKMTSPNDSELKRKLEQLENQINSQVAPQVKKQVSGLVQSFPENIKTWYRDLPSSGKLIVIGGGVIAAFSVLSLFLKLVSTVLSLVFIAGGLYLVYKVFLEEKSSQD